MEETTPYEVPEEKKGGRPKKPKEERRNLKVQTNLNEGEYAEFYIKKKQYSGLSEAEFVRRCILEKEIFTKTEKPIAYKKLRADLGRTMSNINQLAKKVNQGEIQDLTDTNFRALVDYLYNRLEEL